MTTSYRPRFRRSARVAATVLAGAGVLFAGAGAASASPPVDINGDGVPDQYQFDTNGDGFANVWFTDVDNDGVTDEAAFDVDYNTTPDMWVVDRDHDAFWDQIQLDTNRDGYPDSVAAGYVYDTVWGPNPQPSGSGGANCLTPQGYPVDVPMYGDCAFLQTLSQNSNIGPNPFDVMTDAGSPPVWGNVEYSNL
jgi:hypothetical protein